MFRELREYRPGDPMRRIDPRASARTDRWLVRELERESRLRILVALDNAAGLGYPDPADGRPGPRKGDALATLAAAGLEHAVRQGHAAAIARRDGVRAARGGISPIREWREAIELSDHNLPAVESAPAVELVWLLGDFLAPGDPERLRAWGSASACGAEVRVLQWLHRDEAELPIDALRRFVDWNDPRASLDANGADLRDGYLAALEEHQARLVEAAADAGVQLATLVGRPGDWGAGLRFLTAGDWP